LTPSGWQPLGGGIGSSLYDGVEALMVFNGELIAGGSFAIADGSSANNIARWNGILWQPIGSGIDSGVNTLEVYNNELIAGGGFTTAGGNSVKRIARWNGTSWLPLGSGISDGGVVALHSFNGSLYAAGTFNIEGSRSEEHTSELQSLAYL